MPKSLFYLLSPPPRNGSLGHFRKHFCSSDIAHSQLLLQRKPRQMCVLHSCSGVTGARRQVQAALSRWQAGATASWWQASFPPWLQPLHVTCHLPCGDTGQLLKAMESNPTDTMQTPPLNLTYCLFFVTQNTQGSENYLSFLRYLCHFDQQKLGRKMSVDIRNYYFTSL